MRSAAPVAQEEARQARVTTESLSAAVADRPVDEVSAPEMDARASGAAAQPVSAPTPRAPAAEPAPPPPAPVTTVALATKAGEDRGGTMSGRLAREAKKDAADTRGPAQAKRPAPSTPAEPAWMAQGASAPGGQFEGREARFNSFTHTDRDALSTFAIDVDTAAYSIARRTLMSERMPTPSLVRVEEMVNYFRYDYPAPKGEELFSIQADGAAHPFLEDRKLLRVGIQAKEVTELDRRPANLVFLVDTSGSMSSGDKLELTKAALTLAVDRLDARDKVAITTYAGGVNVVLPPTPGNQKQKIKAALRRLRSGGGTAMSSGLELAYQQAAKMLSPDSVTRIIVASDGDANIGSTSPDQILKRIEGYKEEGVFLSTIGFGQGNYKDAMMEQLANRGNGNYYYIDSMRMAQRVFSRDLFKMVQDVAQDVKIQVEFNPESVAAYRLIGYENRDIADKDFRNDKVDAGEIGAGHQVTALYEVVLTEEPSERLATVRVRAKQPRGTKAKEVGFDVATNLVTRTFASAPEDLRFATAVMGGSELLRRSPFAEGWSFADVIRIVSETRPYDEPDRAEFLSLMKKAAHLSGEDRPIGMR
ncbi:MAG: von Willebrand factor type A domain-containing protein [Deltaproteobacteria bacterium]|nr:von Willebrand factor type A domain-containing protein [Deltaproteobacteria bacterium]